MEYEISDDRFVCLSKERYAQGRKHIVLKLQTEQDAVVKFLDCKVKVLSFLNMRQFQWRQAATN